MSPTQTLPAPVKAQDTIFALATPPGRSAVAVYRISGPRAAEAVQAVAGKLPAPRTAAFRRLRHPETRETLDEALVLWFPAPASETGEDLAELQTHGSRAVMAELTRILGALPGVRMAAPGEFARRAFYNGKLDLTAVEGLADLIDAETEAQRRQALLQSSGALARLYDGWRGRILEAMALVEAAIDFSDESDTQAATYDSACELLQAQVMPELRAHLDDGRRGEIVRNGFRVVIAGPPNAGKSSLLNALSRRDVAIVSPEAGTTRDVIEVALDLGGVAVVVSDTAGIREATGAVEQEGIRRSLARAAGADLVLWLIDGAAPASASGTPPEELQGLPALAVLNKADLVGEPEAVAEQRGADIAISAATGAGVPDLIDRITERVLDHGLVASETPVITQARHRQHLGAVLLSLEAFLAGGADHLELRAEELRRAANEIGSITGRIGPEDVLDRIFSRFCIGK
ncbi:MAG: tRNA uridine-5-carboxymethylaminomethyl(34) synthesis GTPase MnmE [Hyphomicrobiales bacterium]|nr:MAG: tRNA uridine-5-carboxymethylaminomethyl(34) synthesis GTPase MnmE [Hyphomicrobiales bacterium]